MKGKLLKKVTAAALSLLIVSGGIPFQPVSDLLGSTVIKAEARTYDSYSHVNCTDCSVGDIFEAGAELFNNTDRTIYLSFPDNPSLYEQLDSREGTIIGVKYKIVSKSGSTWILTTVPLNDTNVTVQPDVNGVILYDGTAKKIIESGAAVSGNQTVYYGISDYYYSEPSSWYTDINSNGLKVTGKGEYFLWIKTNGNSSYKPLSPRVQATITVTDQADMLESYYWGGSNQDGTQSHPFLISDTKGWNFLCEALQHNDIFNRFEGKYFRLNNNITVTRMAGGSQHDFKGTFDGNQKTLTFNYIATGDNAAPFSHADTGCTIKNLHIAGTINTSYKYAAGLIAQVYGTVNIENCRSSVTINSSTDGDGTHGGFVGASNSSSALTIKGCVFDGKFIGSETHAWGGFVGWRNGGAEIYNSVFAPSEIDIKQSKEKCATFARNKIDTYNCYFTETLNDGTNYLPYVDDDTVTPRKCNNGLKAYTISATDNITFSLSGTATTYNVSGITAYANNCGLKYGNTVYAGNGDRVALTLPTTEQNKNYEVNAGTISGSTLTMPAENVTISKFTGGTTGDCTWRLDDNGVLTISGNGAMGNYSSSSTAPWGNNIKSVIIENGVTSIGNYAFRNCDALTNITIPNSVTNIGYFAFSSCGSLTSITIPDSVTSIGSSVFSICENLKSVSFGNGLTSINDFMFSGCENLTTVTMKNNVTSIGKYAFNNCEKLNSINISSAVTTIAENAFYNCKGLTSVTIPASVTSIGENAFYNCNTLTSVTLSEGLKTIDSNAFYNCNALKSVFIPYSVTSIGSRAFGYYDNNNSVNIMKDFKIYGYRGSKAEDYAASGRFTFVRLIRTVSSGTTGDCTWTLDENGLLTISGNGAMGNYTSSSILPWGTDIKSVVIENGVTSIGNYAFYQCTYLTSVPIPDSVTSIGDSAFDKCVYLTSITIPNSVTTIDRYAFYNCQSLTSVTIGNSVTSIGLSAFVNCTNLKSVTIPNSVTSIGNFAFGYYYSYNNHGYVTTDGFTIYCNNTSGAAYNYAVNNGFCFVVSGTTGDCTWTLDENGLLTISGSGAMENYTYSSSAPWGTNIKSVVIENGVTAIGNSAFYHCTGLTSVTIPDSVTTIGHSASEHCTGLTSVTIPNSVTTIDHFAFYNCTGLTSVTIPNSVTTIGNSAFCDCYNLKSVTIPNSVTSIGEKAFGYYYSDDNHAYVKTDGFTIYCDKDSAAYNYAVNNGFRFVVSGTTGDCTWTLDTDGLLTISGSGAIGNYTASSYVPWGTNIKSVIIENGVTAIGSYAFWGCRKLTSITIPDSVTTIGDGTFGNCTVLKSVTIPNSVTTIGDYAFFNCTSLTSVTIPDSVTAIGNTAFAECTGLTNMTIPNSVTTIGDYAFNNCTSLTNMTIPNSVITIGCNAFYDCTGLTSVTIGNSVTTINEMAFFNCTGLTSVTIPDSVTAIGNKAFGYYEDDDYNFVKTDGFTIYGDKDSAAENYATENGFAFVPTVESVDLNKHTLVLGVGQAYTLKPIVTPEGAETTFKWKSSKKDIATVTSLGKVTGRAVGKATITVTTANGKTYSCTVVVKQAPDNITLNKSEMTLGVGQMYTLQSTLTPSNSATYQQWTSSDKTVAVVNDKGRVTGKKVGTATITVKTTNGHTATCVVTVKKAPTSVALDKTSVTLAVGMKETLTATLTPTNSATYCAWSSSDETVATVTSGGVITAKKAGTATITVKTTNDKTATCTVTVKKAPTALELDKTELSLKVGETHTLKKTLTPSNAYTTYTYTSSKTAVATITSSGKVVAKKAGTAIITITTHNGKTATCTVTVK